MDVSPFQTTLIQKKVYADGKDYLDKVSYNLGLRRWTKDCMYLEKRGFGKYKTTHTYDCDEPKNFVCKWVGMTSFCFYQTPCFPCFKISEKLQFNEHC